MTNTHMPVMCEDFGSPRVGASTTVMSSFAVQAFAPMQTVLKFVDGLAIRSISVPSKASHANAAEVA